MLVRAGAMCMPEVVALFLLYVFITVRVLGTVYSATTATGHNQQYQQKQQADRKVFHNYVAQNTLLFNMQVVYLYIFLFHPYGLVIGYTLICYRLNRASMLPLLIPFFTYQPITCQLITY